MTVPFFKKNCCFAQNRGKLAIFGHLQTFLYIYPLDFSEIVPDEKNWKLGKSDSFVFSRKIFIVPKIKEGVTFRSKINTTELFSMVIRFFWKFIWWQALKIGFSFKWLFWIFKENSYYAGQEGNGSFLGPKSTLSNYFYS